MSKRTIIAAVAAIAAFGAGSASAAGLGGLTSSGLGAETKVVAACDSNGVTVAYATTYNTTVKEYQVSGVTLSGLDANCETAVANVAISNGGATTNLPQATLALADVGAGSKT